MRRIVCQCSHVHLAEIDHLVGLVDDPEKFDVSTLTKGQTAAALFVSVLARSDIPWNLVKGNVREVLFWGDGDRVTKIVVKWFPKADKVAKTKFRELWRNAK